MTRTQTARIAILLAGAAVFGIRAAQAAGPPSPMREVPTGSWQLVPLPNSKVPAAWVINTATGDTYLCGTGTLQGRARVACIEAAFPHSHER